MKVISNPIARCHVVELAYVNASSYYVDSLVAVKKISRECLSGGHDNLSNLLGMTGLTLSGLEAR